MQLSGWVCACSMLMAAWFLFRYVGLNLSLAGVALSLLLLFHGPAYLYYTRVWGPPTEFFDQILAAAPGEPVLLNLDLAISCLFIFVCLGIRFADLWMRMTAHGMQAAIAAWKTAKAAVSVAEKRRLWFWVLVVGLGMLLPFLVIDHQLSKITGYLSVDLSAQEKVDLRREEGGSSFYPYNVLINTFAPFLAFCLLAARRLSGRGWKVLGVAFIGLVAIGKMAMLSKAPLAVLVVQLAVVVVLCKSLQVRAGAMIGLTATAVTGFAAMALIAIPSLDGLKVVANFLFYRTFMIVNEGLLEYFAAIPYVLHFTWGSKMGWIADIFSGDPGLPNYWLVSQVHRGELTSTTSVMFLGDAWADWAWLGVTLFPFVFGLLLRALDVQLIARRGKSVGSIAAIALGHFCIFIALTRSLQTMLLTGGLVFLLPFCWLISGRRAAGAAPSAAPQRGHGMVGAT
jgi:oligosaccharide repeat unit polymerase